ncbi:MAG: hypothetical protein HC910_22910 [Spirulinaceae cyanobacterium SM2_1_0]|nr:hypothetical protein [Spirulinaceae cyanobacterium SM2_1_0]
MLTISSISGGKSSAYMALHYPADRHIFAAVLTSDPACIIQDADLRAYCQSKLPQFDWECGGCREVDQTLLNLQRLEQELGQSIDWVAAALTFDELINGVRVNGVQDAARARCYAARAVLPNRRQDFLPNRRQRFCTRALKLYPIFWACYLHGDGDPAIMQIGFRHDEQARVNRWSCKNDQLEVPLRCDLAGQFAGKHRHSLIEWRVPDFPLARDGVTGADVARYWQRRGWEWPLVSNCDFCFFHRPAQQRHQAERYPERAQWWIRKEQQVGATFGDKALADILSPDQLDLFEPDLGQFACACTD